MAVHMSQSIMGRELSQIRITLHGPLLKRENGPSASSSPLVSFVPFRLPIISNYASSPHDWSIQLKTCSVRRPDPTLFHASRLPYHSSAPMETCQPVNRPHHSSQSNTVRFLSIPPPRNLYVGELEAGAMSPTSRISTACGKKSGQFAACAYGLPSSAGGANGCARGLRAHLKLCFAAGYLTAV